MAKGPKLYSRDDRREALYSPSPEDFALSMSRSKNFIFRVDPDKTLIRYTRDWGFLFVGLFCAALVTCFCAGVYLADGNANNVIPLFGLYSMVPLVAVFAWWARPRWRRSKVPTEYDEYIRDLLKSGRWSMKSMKAGVQLIGVPGTEIVPKNHRAFKLDENTSKTVKNHFKHIHDTVAVPAGPRTMDHLGDSDFLRMHEELLHSDESDHIRANETDRVLQHPGQP